MHDPKAFRPSGDSHAPSHAHACCAWARASVCVPGAEVRRGFGGRHPARLLRAARRLRVDLAGRAGSRPSSGRDRCTRRAPSRGPSTRRRARARPWPASQKRPSTPTAPGPTSSCADAVAGAGRVHRTTATVADRSGRANHAPAAVKSQARTAFFCESHASRRRAHDLRAARRPRVARAAREEERRDAASREDDGAAGRQDGCRARGGRRGVARSRQRGAVEGAAASSARAAGDRRWRRWRRRRRRLGESSSRPRSRRARATSRPGSTAGTAGQRRPRCGARRDRREATSRGPRGAASRRRGSRWRRARRAPRGS